MFALKIVAIVFCSVMFILDFVVMIADDSDASAVSFFNMLPLALAIVTLSLSL